MKTYAGSRGLAPRTLNVEIKWDRLKKYFFLVIGRIYSSFKVLFSDCIQFVIRRYIMPLHVRRTCERYGFALVLQVLRF